MLRVGLTGGLASGKSAVARMLREMGAEVSQSDEIARAMMQPGQAVFEAVVQHFGRGVLTSSGTLDRAELARLAFDDGRAEELNDIVHPPVIAAQSLWLRAVEEASPKAVAVVESALIFETRHGSSDGQATAAPWRTRFDVIVVVTAPLEVRRQRYVERIAAVDASADRTAAAADFDRRSALQWSDERRCALADAVLHNTGSLPMLRDATQRLYTAWKQQSCDRAAEAM